MHTSPVLGGAADAATASFCVPVLLLLQVTVVVVDTAQVTDVADAVGVIVTTQLAASGLIIFNTAA